ncbi:S41 family peptidase [Pampinifervens florentissimum]|uniref:S41 family peptidase n=1 Tax=Pampinifervens florentissimum TaxID=1632019 RepID=UPI0020C497C8|nr:S41 family peptidase [Hydrogenobacter sp. T-8]
MSFLLVLLLLHVSFAGEDCSREELLKKVVALMERHYLWWDRIKDSQWKSEQELIDHLRKIGDRWTSITRQEEDRLWYSSSKMIGLGVRWDDKGYVVKVFPKSPAEQHGVREGDLILAINGVNDKNQWRRVIREVEKGGIINLEIIREGLFMEIKVLKGEFSVPVIEEVRIIDHGDKKIGYIKLVNFTQPAVEQFREVMEKFNANNIDVLILDLRDNGGGLISVAKSIVDMLIGGEGVMFYLEGRGRNLGVYQFTNRQSFNKPIIVLVNKHTASASELVATLLRRYAGAVIVGENTVGKYVGSNMYILDSCGNVLRLITFEMKLPSGELVTTDKGINPDCKLEKENPIERSLECLSSQAFGVSPAGQP